MLRKVYARNSLCFQAENGLASTFWGLGKGFFPGGSPAGYPARENYGALRNGDKNSEYKLSNGTASFCREMSGREVTGR